MTTVSSLSGSPVSVKNEDFSSPPKTVSVAIANPKTTKPKSRKRVNTAEKRHQHNAIERQRRETLNGKFLTLARLLPSLASHRRPSKSAIVNGSIAHLTHQRNQRLLASKLLRQVCAERDELFAEVNEWRKASGYGIKEGGSAWTAEMDEIAKVEQETFGEFASVGGENGEDDDGQNTQDNDNVEEESNGNGIEMNIERASALAGSFHGLITPRSSTDVDVMSNVNALYGNANVQASNNVRPISQNGSTWSSDFIFGVTNQSSAVPTSVPFNAFMSDSLSGDLSSSDSPLSFHGSSGPQTTSAVLTPPTSVDLLYGNHTPSPRSSNGVEEVKVVPTQTQVNQNQSQWTPQQMLYLQHQVQQQNLQRQQQMAAFLPATGHGNILAGYNLGVQNSNGATDAFTQSLMASMFPQRDLNDLAGQALNMGMSSEQVNQWRQIALGGLMQHGNSHSRQNQNQNLQFPGLDQPSMADLKNAVRHGMGLGMGMANWSENQHTVEGF